jgi:hypothetical protein
MKVKINFNGGLEIERKGQWKEQFCPFGETSEQFGPDACGDWCPLFDAVVTDYVYQIALCRKTYRGDAADFTDERP